MATFALVLGVAVVAAIGGYLVGRPSRRRSRRVFIAGFLCGSVAGSVLRGRRRRLAQQAMRRVLPRTFSDPRRHGRSRPQKIGLAVR
ncbi:MAG: hypothetical protein U5N53_18245 [Mycobacterium sp.]|nr:hypothetical protein [Mycobacterium sp.]